MKFFINFPLFFITISLISISNGQQFDYPVSEEENAQNIDDLYSSEFETTTSKPIENVSFGPQGRSYQGQDLPKFNRRSGLTIEGELGMLNGTLFLHKKNFEEYEKNFNSGNFTKNIQKLGEIAKIQRRNMTELRNFTKSNSLNIQTLSTKYSTNTKIIENYTLSVHILEEKQNTIEDKQIEVIINYYKINVFFKYLFLNFRKIKNQKTGWKNKKKKLKSSKCSRTRL